MRMASHPGKSTPRPMTVDVASPTNGKPRLTCCLAWAGQVLLIYVRDHSDMVGTRHVRIDWFGLSGQLVNIA